MTSTQIARALGATMIDHWITVGGVNRPTTPGNGHWGPHGQPVKVDSLSDIVYSGPVEPVDVYANVSGPGLPDDCYIHLLWYVPTTKSVHTNWKDV